MKEKIPAVILAFALSVAALVSCDMDLSGASSGGVMSATSYTANTSSRDITAGSYDSIDNFTAGAIISISLDSSTVGGVTASSVEQNVINDSAGTVTVKIEGNLIKINAENYSGGLEFNITGSCSGYGLQIKGNGSDSIKLNLNSVSITSSDTPCIKISAVPTSFVVLSGTNSLTDSRTYGTKYNEDNKGTLYSKGALVFSGSGSLTVTESYKHGIASKDYIKVNGGTITVTSTGRHGFYAVNGFIMNDGTVTVNGNGNHTNYESKGIVVAGEESSTTMGEGFIIINGGVLNIATVGKAITAKWDSDSEDNGGDATDSLTSNDPYPYVKISGGTINITTTGTPTEGTYASAGTIMDEDGVYNTSSEEIKLSPEGIEGKQSVFITGGTITCNTTDDCINASADGSAVVHISGGTIYAYSSKNDAIDSNGTLTISGNAVVVAIAVSNAECAFDCDNYTFAVTGGIIAGIGTDNYSNPTSSACTQGVLVTGGTYLGSKDKVIVLKDSSGNVVYAFKMPVSANNGYVGIFSSSELASGTYTFVYGATASGGTQNHGLYTSMPTVSGGSTAGVTFSSGSCVYTLGSVSNHGPNGR